MKDIYLPLAGLLINAILIIIFFSRKRANIIETKVYSKLIIVGLLETFLACVIIYIAKTQSITSYMVIMQKIDHILIMTYIWLMFLYIFYITIKKITIKNTDKLTIIVFYISIIINIVMIFLIAISKMKIINNTDILNTEGMPTDIVYIMAGIYIILMFFLTVTGLILIKDRKYKKKYFPLIMFVILGIIGLLIRQINPSILFESFLFSYINLIMFFTIENPDIRMIEELNIAKTEAYRANDAKSDFLASMSHEIRTPLNAITGFSRAILNYENLPKEIEEYAQDIVKSSETLLEIVGGVLDVSKIESNKMEIIDVLYNPREEIEDLVKMAKNRIGEKPVNFNYKIAEDVPYQLYGDKTNVKKILTNLLTNAVKYTYEGYILFNIKCINREKVSYLIISVQDTGIGIKPENISKLFQKFERLNIEKNTTAEGTGLGLAITKKLVELMNGKINVKSQYGNGSIFMVQIPQKIAVMTKPLTENEILSTLEIKKTEVQVNEKLFGKKVLIVDDNLLNIKVANVALKDFKLNIDSVTSGEECLNKIKAGNKYDIILMDIMMPHMGGNEVLAELKKITGYNTPVIALTADAISGSKEKYLASGFTSYISKPFTKEEIRNELLKIFK